jgi:hypothetical protein
VGPVLEAALKPLKPQRMREKRKYWSIERDYILQGNRDKFSAMKVPRQCPLVLLVKVG